MVQGNYSMDIFNEPFVLNLKEYRQWKKDRSKALKLCRANKDDGFDDKWDEYYKKYNDNKFNSVGFFNDDEDEDELKAFRISYIEYGDRSKSDSYDRGGYQARLDGVSKTKDGDYDYTLRNKEVLKIYEEVSKEKIKPNWWKQPWKYSWNYMHPLVKDLDSSIIVCGSDDNSIPYEIWDVINGQLGGTNYHLG